MLFERSDLMMLLNWLAPENASWCFLANEGPDDMPAHVKALLDLGLAAKSAAAGTSSR